MGISYGPVPVSVTHLYCIETGAWVELVFGQLASLHLSYNLCFKESWVFPKISVLPFGICPKLCTVKKFSHGMSTVAVCDKQATVIGLLLTTFIDS